MVRDVSMELMMASLRAMDTSMTMGKDALVELIMASLRAMDICGEPTKLGSMHEFSLELTRNFTSHIFFRKGIFHSIIFVD